MLSMRMFRFTAPKAALAAGLLTGGLLLAAAAPALADTSTPAPQVCAPGAMTITRGGPTVYDGVDCTPGSAAAPSAAGPASAAPAAAAAAPPAEPPAAPPAATVAPA